MKKFLIIIAAASTMIVAFLCAGPVFANPLFFNAPYVSTAIATTTPSYMTAGTATTTLTYDTYASVGNITATLKGALLVQLVGSSTATVLNVNTEYSQDGIDWYQDAGLFNVGYATSSKPVDIGQVNQFTFAFASSTAGLGAVPALNATTSRAIPVSTPTRFVRFVFTLPVGSKSGAVWAQFVPQKEYAEK